MAKWFQKTVKSKQNWQQCKKGKELQEKSRQEKLVKEPPTLPTKGMGKNEQNFMLTNVNVQKNDFLCLQILAFLSFDGIKNSRFLQIFCPSCVPRSKNCPSETIPKVLNINAFIFADYIFCVGK